jgi:hypothetical protein
MFIERPQSHRNLIRTIFQFLQDSLADFLQSDFIETIHNRILPKMIQWIHWDGMMTLANIAKVTHAFSHFSFTVYVEPFLES